VSDIVAEIAAASREQSSGIEQVNKAVMQMDEMTQQNAALVEEATAASQSMAEQARALNEMMERYQLTDAQQAATAQAAARPAQKAVAPAPAKRAAAAQPERRGANRPWNGAKAEGGKSEEAAAPARPSKAVANGEAAEWSEF
jgi:methyl-accepting chemotaxis protein